MPTSKKNVDAEAADTAEETPTGRGPLANMKVKEDDDGNLLLDGTEERVGIAPETGEIVSVTPETLMAAKGLTEKEAGELYLRIAKAGGFFIPEAEPYDYRPALGVHGLRGKRREAVDKLLAA